MLKFLGTLFKERLENTPGITALYPLIVLIAGVVWDLDVGLGAPLGV